MEKIGEYVLLTLIKAAIALIICVAVLIAISISAESSTVGVSPSIITEGQSSRETPIGWHPPLLL